MTNIILIRGDYKCQYTHDYKDIYADQQGDNNLQKYTKFVKKHQVVTDRKECTVGGL